MQENEAKKNSETELDLKNILSAVGRKWWVLAICALLLGALAFGYTRFFVTPKYQSSAMFYVNNGSLSMGDTDITLSSGALTASKRPGLSGCLTGQNELTEVVQHCTVKNGDPVPLDAIASGQTPPNPVELLSSAKMSSLLETLKQSYQYIILDLPPVAEVTDALAVAKETDGVLLVVRQRYCTRLALRDTVQQFDYVDSRILGVVYNCVDDPGVAYSNTYKRYYRRYSRRYYGSYVRNIADPRFSIRKDDSARK